MLAQSCHPCHRLVIVCNEKKTMWVQMHAYMRGGTVPKDRVQTDKPRLASGSFCLHSKEACSATCSREFSPHSALWRIVPCHLSCKWWKSPCVDEFVSFISQQDLWLMNSQRMSKVTCWKPAGFAICGTSCHIHPLQLSAVVLPQKA